MIEVDVDAWRGELMLIVLISESHYPVIVVHDPRGDIGPVPGPVIHQHLVLVRRRQKVWPEKIYYYIEGYLFI